MLALILGGVSNSKLPSNINRMHLHGTIPCREAGGLEILVAALLQHVGDVKVCGSVAATLAILCENGNSKVKHVAFKVTGDGAELFLGELTKCFRFWLCCLTFRCHQKWVETKMLNSCENIVRTILNGDLAIRNKSFQAGESHWLLALLAGFFSGICKKTTIETHQLSQAKPLENPFDVAIHCVLLDLFGRWNLFVGPLLFELTHLEFWFKFHLSSFDSSVFFSK